MITASGGDNGAMQSMVTPAHPVLARHNVKVSGQGSIPMIFAHGFGCDQNMWRKVAPAFAADYRIITFDYIGHGESDRSAYSASKYASLDGYVTDLLDICDALGVEHGVFVGHSVSAMIGALAAIREPRRFDTLVMIGPSPRYLNDGEYLGGFERADIDGLLDALDSNYLGWANSMAPVIMGNGDRPELGVELANAFCRTDPEVARQFARVTFLSDNRADLAKVPARCLVLQCASDVIAPASVGEFVHQQLPTSTLVHMRAVGHCPNVSEPDETVAAIRAFLG
jgi:sigma-B regulation protein RsbQ